MKLKNILFASLMGCLALSIASVAAYYSITGLSKLFVGAATAIIILTTILEVAKIGIASYLHQFWKEIATAIKVYLIIAIIFLMFITSLGVYGFLSSGYSKTSIDLSKINEEITLIENKQDQKQKEISRFELDIEAKRSRIENLSDVRKQQETRLDSLYNKGWYTSAKQTETIIKKADSDIEKLYAELDTITAKIQRVDKIISDYDVQILELNSNDVVGDVGPLKYISKMTNLPMDSVVNYIMLILMFVADPLAVILVIVTNSILKGKTTKPEKKLKPKETEIIKKEIPVTKEKTVEKTIKVENYNEEFEYLENQRIDEKTEEKVVEHEVENVSEPILSKIEPDVMESDIIKDIDDIKKTKYVQLLNLMYDNGNKKKGDEIPRWSDFQSKIKESNIDVIDKEIKDFLIICNLLKITEMNKVRKVYIKNYNEALQIIRMLNG